MISSSLNSYLLTQSLKNIYMFNNRSVLCMGSPCGSAGKESTCNEETWVHSLGWEDPLEKGTATHSRILAWRIPWIGTVHGVAKSWTRLNDFRCLRCTWASQVDLVVQNTPASAGDVRGAGLIPGLGRSPGGGHGNPLQSSCLESPMDRGA